jgi:hypothetical protein
LTVPIRPSAGSSTSVFDGDTRVQIPISEAADRMDISLWQAYQLAKSGRLATSRIGHRLYVPAAVMRRIEREGLPTGGEVA